MFHNILNSFNDDVTTKDVLAQFCLKPFAFTANN